MDVPEKLKKALFEKGWSQKKLCGAMGVTENGLKNMIDRNSWKLETIEKMSAILELPITYFLTNSEEKLDYSPRAVDGGAFGDKVINKMTAGIQELREMFEEELRAKNQQIAGLLENQRSLQDSQKSLQRMLETVLGKSRGATFTQLSEEEAFETIKELYLQAGKSKALSPAVSKPRRLKVPTPAKSVALRSL